MAWSSMSPIILTRSFWADSGEQTPSDFMEEHINLSIFQPQNLNAAIGGVAFSALSRLQNDPVRFKSYFLKGYSLVISMTAPITIFCALFADDIVLVAPWTEMDRCGSHLSLADPDNTRCLVSSILWRGCSIPIGLQGRSLRIALVIAPLVIAAYLLGLPYGPNGVAFAFSAAMTLWLVPHVVWCVHGTMISPSDVFGAIWRPFLASIVIAALVYGVMSHFGQLLSPSLRLLVGGSVMVGLYAWMLLFVMGQKSFYFDLVRTLKGSLPRDLKTATAETG